MIKKLLHLTTLLLTLCWQSSFGESASLSVGGLSYRIADISNSFCNVTPPPTGEEYSGDIEIPDSITYNGKKYGVFVINQDAFKNCTGVTSIVIPQTVGLIYQNAFSGCTGLKRVIFSDKKWTSIQFLNTASSGKYWKAFEDCPLEYVYLGCMLDLKGRTNGPFKQNSTIKKVEIGKYVTELPNYTFYDCKSLNEVIVSDGDKSISGSWIFDSCPIEKAYLGRMTPLNCETLKSITIGETVTEIPDYAFSGCTQLSEISLPKSLKTIGNYAFMNCSQLTEISVPSAITKIGYYAFSGCSQITEIYLPTSLTTIENYTFSGCSNLKSIKIPDKTTSIGKFAFSDCSQITEITLPQSIIEIGNSVFNNCTSLQEITLPASLTKIGDYTFNNCTSLSSIALPDKITTIGESAFNKCMNLTEITLPASLVEIGESAFNGCSSLTSIELPTALQTIGRSAFSSCTSLSEISIPVSVTAIGPKAFSGMTATIKMNPCLPLTYNCLLELNSNSTVYAHLLDKNLIKSEWNGKTIYFEEIDISSNTNFLCGIDLSLNSSSENLLLPIKSISVGNRDEALITESDNIYSIRNLLPDQLYYINVNDQESTHIYAFRTSKPTIRITVSEKTQTTLTGIVTASSDQTATPVCSLDYNECINEQPIKITGLRPGVKFTLWGSATYNGEYFSSSIEATSYGMGEKGTVTATPTKLIFEGSYDDGDATVTSFGFANTEKEVKNGTFDGKMTKTMANLDPETKGEIYFGVKVEENSDPYYKYLFGSTTKLTWSEGDYVATSTKSARLRVATNCDAETGTGIEWRRNDAPDNVKSTYVACPVVDGILVGSLRNLNPEVYYKFRPVYESASGNKYYGAWAGFYTGDASVYFDPEVRTLDDIEVFENSALVYCYVMPGSDDIRRQGIQYWHKGGITSRADNGRMEITTTGIKSNASLPDLIPGTEYTYRAFAETASGTVYGEEKTFTTKGTSGIVDTFADKTEELTVSLRNNPSSSPVYVTISGTNAVTAQVRIVSMTGRTVAQETIPTNTETEIELNTVPGYYLLIANDGVNQTSEKLIIRN